MKNWTIKKQITAGLAAIVVGILALGWISVYSLHRTATKIRVAESKARVDGALYNEIVQGKDVLADVLPPPAYVLESYLVALQLTDASDKAETDKLIGKLTQLRKDFSDSRARWTHDLPSGKLKEAFTKSIEPAARFYDIVDNQFMPCITAGDRAKAKEIAGTTLAQNYNQQRAEIDKVVACATELNASQAKELQNILSTSEKEVSAGIGSATILTIVAILSIALPVGILGSLFAASITKSLLRTAEKINEGASQTSSSSEQVSGASQSLAEGASEQAASLEETSSSLEEMASMTRRNSESAQKANDLAKRAREAADKGAGDMQAMATAMEAIKASSDDIAKIIKTIDEIAFQTNILALNAAVEAARAGEAGMGFAVVADEVRNLAQRSAQAAKETAGKIEGAIAKTTQGVEISAKVVRALNEIVGQIRQVDELVSEVAGASHEQTQGISQINTAVSQMDKVTQSNAANAEESAAAAQELNAQSATMNESVTELLQLVGGRGESVKTKPAAPTSRMTAVRAVRPGADRRTLASVNGMSRK